MKYQEEGRKSWCGGKDSNLHGIATASPSSWCVCQFRHHRKFARKRVAPRPLEETPLPDYSVPTLPMQQKPSTFGPDSKGKAYCFLGDGAGDAGAGFCCEGAGELCVVAGCVAAGAAGVAAGAAGLLAGLDEL